MLLPIMLHHSMPPSPAVHMYSAQFTLSQKHTKSEDSECDASRALFFPLRSNFFPTNKDKCGKRRKESCESLPCSVAVFGTFRSVRVIRFSLESFFFLSFFCRHLHCPKAQKGKNKSLALSLRQQSNVVIAKWKSQFCLLLATLCGRKIG